MNYYMKKIFDLYIPLQKIVPFVPKVNFLQKRGKGIDKKDKIQNIIVLYLLRLKIGFV
jgi:hypothetical protein